MPAYRTAGCESLKKMGETASVCHEPRSSSQALAFHRRCGCQGVDGDSGSMSAAESSLPYGSTCNPG
ncbi:hypothetical protein L873DRAFT_1814614 [Choiromyces venosus 120613-1]|uniref:Uncharacterized protein n=1 Tax=Choiromyces venosus 120613-1 TaxID=1336337 RepID=A0A3N4J7W3_9PEZI|nr:hypothetical protein L873DRAFT_1814614 [Choiromyces venosus 120613-1]